MRLIFCSQFPNLSRTQNPKYFFLNYAKPPNSQLWRNPCFTQIKNLVKAQLIQCSVQKSIIKNGVECNQSPDQQCMQASVLSHSLVPSPPFPPNFFLCSFIWTCNVTGFTSGDYIKMHPCADVKENRDKIIFICFFNEMKHFFRFVVG